MIWRTLNLVAVSLSLATLAGCGGKQAARDKSRQRDDRQQRSAGNEPPPPREWRIDRPEPATMQSQTQELPVDTGPTLVKQGPPPLVYIVEAPNSITVIDLNTQQRLASAPVAARTIVRVEARGGVIFGEQRLLPGPLPAEHQYGIYLEPSPINQIRNETVAPVPRGSAQPRQGQPQRSAQPQTRPQ